MAPLFSLSELWFVCGRNKGRGGKTPAFVSAIETGHRPPEAFASGDPPLRKANVGLSCAGI
jgi:hypothetical protein